MILITSGAYVGEELQTGLGKVPPCMMPIGNRPIFEFQVEVLRRLFPHERLVVSLPANFQPSSGHEAMCRNHGVACVAVKEGLSLADSVLYVINAALNDDDNLRILHGDTLIFDLPDGDDLIVTGSTQSDYSWEIEHASTVEEIVWSGYFAFSQTRLLARCLALSGGDFAAAVHSYDAARRLRRVRVERWLDVGHMNTFFSSREKLTTARSFNSIQIGDGYVRKSGEQHRKIEAEIHWLSNVPLRIKLRTPQLLESGQELGRPYYITEYLNLLPLNELFVHGRHPVIFWNSIYGHCDAFLKDCRDAFATLPGALRQEELLRIQADAQQLRVDKTGQRLLQFAAEREFDVHRSWRINGRVLPSLWKLFELSAALAERQSCIPGVMHGDFCFSNILYDSRANAIKVIDPRGLTHGGVMSIYGDLSYDLAKLTHSVIGLYDYILAGLFELRVDDDYALRLRVMTDSWLLPLQEAYLGRTFLDGSVTPKDSLPQTILLFLSMLPLHADDPMRQLALMGNAYRLYIMLDSQILEPQ